MQVYLGKFIFLLYELIILYYYILSALIHLKETLLDISSTDLIYVVIFPFGDFGYQSLYIAMLLSPDHGVNCDGTSRKPFGCIMD